MNEGRNFLRSGALYRTRSLLFCPQKYLISLCTLCYTCAETLYPFSDTKYRMIVLSRYIIFLISCDIDIKSN